MKAFIVVVAAMAVLLSACTDAGMGKLKAYGDPAHVICATAGVVLYDGYSTGKVASEANSDGYFFEDAHTSSLREVSGNCSIEYGVRVPDEAPVYPRFLLGDCRNAD